MLKYKVKYRDEEGTEKIKEFSTEKKMEDFVEHITMTGGEIIAAWGE